MQRRRRIRLPQTDRIRAQAENEPAQADIEQILADLHDIDAASEQTRRTTRLRRRQRQPVDLQINRRVAGQRVAGQPVMNRPVAGQPVAGQPTDIIRISESSSDDSNNDDDNDEDEDLTTDSEGSDNTMEVDENIPQHISNEVNVITTVRSLPQPAIGLQFQTTPLRHFGDQLNDPLRHFGVQGAIQNQIQNQIAARNGSPLRHFGDNLQGSAQRRGAQFITAQPPGGERLVNISPNVIRENHIVVPESPSKRVKLTHTTTSAQQTTPGLIKNGGSSPGDVKQQKKADSSDEEDQSCPICFDLWTNSGAHRIASLSCGHLFGRSCIERWLKDPKNKCCPQCKSKAAKKDIRNIYAKKLKAIDTTDRDQARKELAEEKYRRSKAEENEAKALLKVQLLQSEMDKLKRQCERIPSMMEQRQPVAGGRSSTFLSSQQPSSSQSNNISSSQQQRNIATHLESITKKYVFQKILQVSNKEARVMAYDNQRMLMAVSKPSPNQLFPGYGILKISSLDSRSSEYIRIHQKGIRDAKFNQSGDELLLTASLDRTLKITSMLSNSIVQSYTCEAPVWACTWDGSNTNYVYAGLQNGACCVYDIRKTDGAVVSLRPRVGTPCPIVSISSVTKAEESTGCDGIVVGTLQGGWFIKRDNIVDFTDHQLLFPNGSSGGISYEASTRHCLLSQRPGKQISRMTHSIYKLDGDGTTSDPLCVNSVLQCYGGNRSRFLSRSSLFTCPDDASRLMVCSGDEASSSVVVWDGSRGVEHQKISTSGGFVFDVMSFNAYDSQFLAALTEQKLSFYKWQ